MTRLLLFFTTLALYLPSTGSATDLDRNKMIELESKWSQTITSILRRHEKDAFALVKVKEKKSKKEQTKLPLTPFYLDSSTLSASNNLEIDSIEVTIFSAAKELPADVSTVIKDFLLVSGVNPKLVLRSLPESMRTVNWLEEQKRKSYWNRLVEYYFTHLPAIIMTLIGLVTLCFLFILHSFVGNRSLNKIYEAISSSNENGIASAPSFDTRIPPSSPSNTQDSRSDTPRNLILKSDGLLKDFSTESLEAIFTDCYWGEFDSYAAFLWKQMVSSQKRELLNSGKAPFISDYVKYLQGVEPHNMHLEDDPSYLTPLPIYQADAEQLSKMVSKQPSLYRKLSELRRKSLTLSATELLQRVLLVNIPKDKKVEDKENSILSNLKPGPMRKLKSHHQIQIRSVKEEEELLQVSSVPFELMQCSPSLIWSQQLSDESLKEVLADFSARDLAALWIGPEPVLDRFKNLISKKKRDLLEQYMSRVTTGRQEPSYVNFHNAIMEKIANPVPALEDQEEAKNVA